MSNYFALTVTEMGIGKIELVVIGAVILIFPILFVYAYQKFGLTIKFLAFITFYSALIIIFFTDFKYYLILDKITYPITIIGFGFVLFDESPFEIEMFESLLGGAIGFFTIYLIRYIFFKIRKNFN